MLKTYVGIDVGFEGAIVAIHLGIGIDRETEIIPMPTYKVNVGARQTKKGDTAEKIRTELDGRAIVAHLRRWKVFGDEIFVTIERPQMRPGTFRDKETGELHVNQGAASQARFLAQADRIQGILEALEIPFEFVHPATWKADVWRGQAHTKGDGKDLARQKASQLFPRFADRFVKKNSHGLAEALLIADYGRRRREAEV